MAIFGELQHLLPPAVAADMRKGLVELEEMRPEAWSVLDDMRAKFAVPVEPADDVCPRRRQLVYTAHDRRS